jgi:predicted nucleic acid-binding protein
VITYVDTSVLIKLLVDEPGSSSAAQLWQASGSVVSVALVQVEARAALAGAARAGRLSAAQHRRTTASLHVLLDQMDLVEVTTDLIDAASELAEAERLRGYDAMHLAAALLATEVMASADHDLCAAAARRGLAVANPVDAGDAPT